MKVWVGIDVAKDSLAVWIRPLNHSFTVANTLAGYQEMVKRCRGHGVQRLLVESTGGYEQGVVEYCLSKALPIARIMPQRARAFPVRDRAGPSCRRKAGAICPLCSLAIPDRSY